MSEIYVENNALVANQEDFTLNFDYLAVIPSLLRINSYSFMYKNGSEIVELMTSAKTEEEARDMLTQLQKQLNAIREGQYSQATNNVIVNYGKVKDFVKVRHLHMQPHTAIKFKDEELALVTTNQTEMEKLKQEFLEYKANNKNTEPEIG